MKLFCPLDGADAVCFSAFPRKNGKKLAVFDLISIQRLFLVSTAAPGNTRKSHLHPVRHIIRHSVVIPSYP